MTKPAEKSTAREFVWTHRIRQRIAFERIVMTVGTVQEQARAKQFLDAMAHAHPGLLDEAEQYVFEFLREHPASTPELFDESEYCEARGRKTALKLPGDIAWEERIICRAVREFRDLFHPCDNMYENAMKGLRYLSGLHPQLFARARAQAIEHRNEILCFEVYCKCNCTTPESRQPADAFLLAAHGRFANVSQRIALARQDLQGGDGGADWRFFLDRIAEIAPEMLPG